MCIITTALITAITSLLALTDQHNCGNLPTTFLQRFDRSRKQFDYITQNEIMIYLDKIGKFNIDSFHIKPA